MLQLLLSRWNPIACVKRQLAVVDVSEFAAPNQVQSLDREREGDEGRGGVERRVGSGVTVAVLGIQTSSFMEPDKNIFEHRFVFFRHFCIKVTRLPYYKRQDVSICTYLNYASKLSTERFELKFKNVDCM